MLKSIKRFAILLVVFGLLSPTLVWSQTQNEVNRGINRLNRDIEFAKELVQSFNSQRAQLLVSQAERLRNEALTAIQSGRLQEAAAKVTAAHSLLQQALKVTLEGPVKRWRSRLEELLRRAEHEVLASPQKEAQRVFRKAQEIRRAAEGALAKKQYRTALEQFQVAANWAEKALDLARSVDSSARDSFIEEKQRFELLKQRAQRLIEGSENQRAKRIYEQAIKMFRSAEDALHVGNLQLAKRLYNQSVLLLLRAMDLAKGNAGDVVNDVAVALNRLTELIDNTEESILKSRAPRAMQLLQRAKTYTREAELAAQEGKNHEALWKMDLAESLLRRSHRFARNRGGFDIGARITREIDDARTEILDVRSNLPTDAPADAEVLINMAQLAVNRAEQAAGAGFERLALESVLAAQRFLTRAERILDARDAAAVSDARIQLRLKQLDAAITEAETTDNSGLASWNRRLLQGAKDLRQMAVDSMQRGNNRAAEEGIQVALELVKKSLR